VATGSIRFRLTLWYALALAAVLAASGVFWYVYLERIMLGHLDEHMLTVAEDVATFYAFAPVETIPVDDDGRCRGLEEFLHRREWPDDVQLRNFAGELVCVAKRAASGREPLPTDLLEPLQKGKTLVTSQPSDGGDGHHRLMLVPYLQDNAWRGLVMVSGSHEQIDETLRHLLVVLLTFSPLTLLAMSIGGWFLAGRALAPMLKLTRAMRQVSADNLSRRLPLENTSEEIAQLAATFNAMLERLEDSFRRIRQFSGDASHELRTPLTILKGETEVALRWAKDPDEFRNMLISNLEEVNRMERIIDDLLQLAKSDSGELLMELGELSLSDLLQEIYLQGRALAGGKGIEVTLSFGIEEEVRIVADELRLRQLFLNLVSNAVKYTPDGGKVVIDVQLDQEHAMIAVTDSGFGIAAEHLPRIFDRFYRIDAARNRNIGGSGLGLAIVKMIVEAHQGVISVESTPGEGSCFRVSLPLRGPQRGSKS